MIDFKLNTHLHKTDISDSTLYHADCFDVFPLIEDKSVDAIICDLPYGSFNFLPKQIIMERLPI